MGYLTILLTKTPQGEMTGTCNGNMGQLSSWWNVCQVKWWEENGCPDCGTAAVARMRETHLDPAHFARILVRLEAHRAGQEEKAKEAAGRARVTAGRFLSTHPATAARINKADYVAEIKH